VLQPWEKIPEDVFEERADDPGVALCPSCLEPTRPNAHFCHTCLCPLTWYAGTGPLERVWAWPWIVWRAGRTPWPRPIHAWGATLALLGYALAPLVLVVQSVAQGGWVLSTGADPPWSVLAMLIYGVMLAILTASGLILIVRAWVNQERMRVDPWADDVDEAVTA
jgi:hypothetical protein